jgi:hypothetical protein
VGETIAALDSASGHLSRWLNQTRSVVDTQVRLIPHTVEVYGQLVHKDVIVLPLVSELATDLSEVERGRSVFRRVNVLMKRAEDGTELGWEFVKAGTDYGRLSDYLGLKLYVDYLRKVFVDLPPRDRAITWALMEMVAMYDRGSRMFRSIESELTDKNGFGPDLLKIIDKEAR